MNYYKISSVTGDTIGIFVGDTKKEAFEYAVHDFEVPGPKEMKKKFKAFKGTIAEIEVPDEGIIRDYTGAEFGRLTVRHSASFGEIPVLLVSGNPYGKDDLVPKTTGDAGDIVSAWRDNPARTEGERMLAAMFWMKAGG